MRAFVFTDRALAKHAGQFVWLSIDTEKAQNAAFVHKYPIRAWPSLYVIDPEKEAVVLSLVRSNAEGDLGFLADIRRMNVALTRARKKLVVIGDGATVARHPFYEAFLHYAQRIGAWRSAWER